MTTGALIAEEPAEPAMPISETLVAAEAANERDDWPEAAGLYEQALDQELREPDSEASLRLRLEVLESLADLYLFRLQQSGRALPHYEEAVVFRRRLQEMSDRRARLTWSHLGHIYHDLEAYPQALELMREALQREEAEHGADSPKLISELVRLGWLLQQVEPTSPEVEEILLRASTLSVGESAERQERVATALARYYRDQGELEQAAVYFADAFEALRSATTPEHDDLADLAQDLAEVQVALGQLEEAVTSFKTALELDEARLGASNPQLSRTLLSLGEALWFQGRTDEALDAFERAVEITQVARRPAAAETIRQQVVSITQRKVPRRILMETLRQEALDGSSADARPDPSVDPLEAKVQALRAAGEIEAAAALLRTELAARERRDGPDSASVLEVLGQLGSLFWSLDAEEAIHAYERKLEILRKNPATGDETLGRVAGSIGYLNSTLKRYDAAETWYLERVDRYSRSSPDTERLADAVEDLAWVRDKLGKFEEAVEDAELALALWIELVGEEAPMLRGKHRFLANTLAKAERFEEAERILLHQLDGLSVETLSKESWLDLERTYGSLQRLYRAAGREQEAERMKERRNALFRDR